MMTIATYVHLISLILQVCLLKAEIGTKLQGKGTKVKEIERRQPNARKEPTQARNVVGHDIFRVPRKSSDAARAGGEGRDNVVLHDIPRCYTGIFGDDANVRAMSCYTTF